MNLLRRYTRWLHTQWPAGTVEKLPRVDDDGSTNVPGLYIVGDLSGIPLLKFSSHTGARAVRTILAGDKLQRRRQQQDDDVLDLVIIGAGVSGRTATCSACVQACPTGVLELGQIDVKSGEVIRRDRLPASPVLMAERAGR